MILVFIFTYLGTVTLGAALWIAFKILASIHRSMTLIVMDYHLRRRSEIILEAEIENDLPMKDVTPEKSNHRRNHRDLLSN